MKKKKYWMVVSSRNVPIVINGQLPIYWYKRAALAVAKEFGANIIPVYLNSEITP